MDYEQILSALMQQYSKPIQVDEMQQPMSRMASQIGTALGQQAMNFGGTGGEWPGQEKKDDSKGLPFGLFG